MTLKEWQDWKKISNTKLAGLLEVHISYITLINNGKRTVSPDLAARIEKITDGQVTRLEMLYPMK